MRNLLVAAAISLFCLPRAHAQVAVGTVYTPAQLGINGATLSSNPSFSLPAQGYTSVTVYINLSYVAATSVTLNCYAGNFADKQATLGVASVSSSGVITMSDASWMYPTQSKSRLFRIIVAPLADRTVTCTVGGTGATTDTVVVGAYGVH